MQPKELHSSCMASVGPISMHPAEVNVARALCSRFSQTRRRKGATLANTRAAPLLIVSLSIDCDKVNVASLHVCEIIEVRRLFR